VKRGANRGSARARGESAFAVVLRNRGPLEVGARQSLRIDGTLEVGTAVESITVTEAALLLITESSEVGYNVTSKALSWAGSELGLTEDGHGCKLPVIKGWAVR
jgi:uncharacterized protein (AIM24 family)